MPYAYIHNIIIITQHIHAEQRTDKYSILDTSTAVNKLTCTVHNNVLYVHMYHIVHVHTV